MGEKLSKWAGLAKESLNPALVALADLDGDSGGGGFVADGEAEFAGAGGEAGGDGEVELGDRFDQAWGAAGIGHRGGLAADRYRCRLDYRVGCRCYRSEGAR